jgi:DNA-binding transcriptional LysR family regulator
MDQLLALRVFVRIAETGAFAKASDSLSIPRPTVTKLVQDLEAHLGVKLLQRTTRRVNVTAEGAAYYERAVRLIGDLEDMDSLVAHTRKLPRGHLRVDIGSSLANLILLPALPRFRALYPDITLSVGVSDRPLDLIESGVDCVIRGGALGDTSLVARRLAELDYVTCASPAYLATRGVPTHPAQLQAGHALFGYFSSLTGRSFPMLFARKGERLEITAPTQVAVNESTAHLTGLLAGLGVGQTFGFMARPHFARGALSPLMEDWDRPHHPLHLLYPPNRHLQAKLRVFVDWVVEVFAPFDWRA